MTWSNYTPLSLAFPRMLSAKVEIVALLLDHGADANQKIYTKDSFYETPLHRAVNLENHNQQTVLELVTLLLKSGADATLKNSLQQTPLDLYLNRLNNNNGVRFFPNQKPEEDIVVKTLKAAMKSTTNDNRDEPDGCTIF